MKVSQINSSALYVDSINRKQNNSVLTKEIGLDLISIPNYLNFRGRPMINKVSLVKDSSKAVQAKVIKMYNLLPLGTKITQPLLFVSEGQKYGMLINKMENGEFKVKVKDMIEKVEEWASPKHKQSTITCIFDNNGVMQEGEFLNRINDNYTKRICYFTKGEQCRRLKVDGMLFRPSHGENKDVWNRIRDLSTNSAVDEVNFKTSMANTNLSEIFFELTKNRASVLK